MRRWQWALLVAVAMVAATWANGTESWCLMAVAGVVGFLIGYALAHRVLR
jgi:ElaB/YqjD/DUF883 family membrane-anchored ribosome-binding protein